MATYKIVIFNNYILKYSEDPILFVGGIGKYRKFMTKNGKKNVSEFVLNHFQTIHKQEMETSPYAKFYKPERRDIDYDESIDQIMKIYAIKTPIYKLIIELLSSDAHRLVLRNPQNEMVDITRQWQTDRIRILGEEIVKYSELLLMLSAMVNNSLKFNNTNTALALRVSGHEVMQLFYIDTKTIINPFKYMTFLSGTKLFAHAFIAEEDKVLTFFDKPCVFNTVTNKGSTRINIATRYDILQMCNIKHNLKFSQQAMILLIGGLALNRLGATNENFNLPTDGTIYISYTTDATGALQANQYARTRKELANSGAEIINQFSLMHMFLLRTLGNEGVKYLTEFEEARFI